MSVPATMKPDEAEMSPRQVREAFAGLLLVLFVSMISGTIVSTALPKIIGALNGSQSQYTWVVTATLLAATVTTPIWGKLSDLYSKKLLVQISIVIFVVGSLLSGMAQDAGQLIGARAFQGIGVGGLQALVQVAIAAMIPPRERGRYNGLLGGVMAVATVGGPLLGGLIVDTSWLGWRWCFFIGVPISIIALAVLQKTLHLATVRRANVKIDYLGAALIAVGVSILLIWVSFVGNSFDWLSWQTAVMVGVGLVILAVAVWVEARVAEPIVPLDIIRRRTTALAILASLAVGMAMFGGAVFLGQYFQIGRGYSPTEAGLLTIPMMVGVLFSSAISGQLISRSGKIKPYIVAGTVILVIGFAMLSTIDHATSLTYLSGGMLLVGVGVGMSMQNLVLAVQNDVPLRDLGAASSSVAFFRSLGGTVGVSVLGAILANRITEDITSKMIAAGVPAGSGDGASNLNLAELTGPMQQIVRAAYGDATGHIFLISAGIAVLGIIAALLLKPTMLRSTVDITSSASTDNGTGASTGKDTGTAADNGTGSAADTGTGVDDRDGGEAELQNAGVREPRS
ncbi:MDR family MFS transporter [Micromonospora sonneratiae]|uniref:MDR family MFS transporter n=1 Tax=Micromonospora sonneratiae TaxID=1184706 RepID=A0ABW3YK47_9ACTN